MDLSFSWGMKWHGYFNLLLHWTREGVYASGMHVGWWTNFGFNVSLSLFSPHIIIRLPGVFFEVCWPVDARDIFVKG